MAFMEKIGVDYLQNMQDKGHKRDEKHDVGDYGRSFWLNDEDRRYLLMHSRWAIFFAAVSDF